MGVTGGDGAPLQNLKLDRAPFFVTGSPELARAQRDARTDVQTSADGLASLAQQVNEEVKRRLAPQQYGVCCFDCCITLCKADRFNRLSLASAFQIQRRQGGITKRYYKHLSAHGTGNLQKLEGISSRLMESTLAVRLCFLCAYWTMATVILGQTALQMRSQHQMLVLICNCSLWDNQHTRFCPRTCQMCKQINSAELKQSLPLQMLLAVLRIHSPSLLQQVRLQHLVLPIPMLPQAHHGPHLLHSRFWSIPASQADAQVILLCLLSLEFEHHLALA
jgi:hypothetical protein